MIPLEELRRQRIDQQIQKKDDALMDFKSECFFFSEVCDFEESDKLDEAVDIDTKLLTEKYNFERKIHPSDEP